MSRYWLPLLALAVLGVRNASAADVDNAPVVHTFGSHSTNPVRATSR